MRLVKLHIILGLLTVSLGCGGAENKRNAGVETAEEEAATDADSFNINNSADSVGILPFGPATMGAVVSMCGSDGYTKAIKCMSFKVDSSGKCADANLHLGEATKLINDYLNGRREPRKIRFTRVGGIRLLNVCAINHPDPTKPQPTIPPTKPQPTVPPTKPEPTSPPTGKCGVNSYGVFDYCKDGKSFTGAKYACHDGSTGTVGEGTCTSSEILFKTAEKLCANRCSK